MDEVEGKLDTLTAQVSDGGLVRFAGAVTSDDGTTERELVNLEASSPYILEAVYFKRTAGSATNYRLRLAESTGWTLGDITSERYDSGSIGVGTQLAASGLDVVIWTDANGKLYWETGLDSGADNDAYVLWDLRQQKVGT